MDDRNLRNPHDRFFYFSFSEVDVARACLLKLMPAGDAECIDLSTLRLATEFIPVPQPLTKFIPQLSYSLFDVHRASDDDFRDQSFLHAALLVLKYVRSNDLIRQVGPILELLKLIPNEIRELNRLEAVLVYILTPLRSSAKTI